MTKIIENMNSFKLVFLVCLLWITAYLLVSYRELVAQIKPIEFLQAIIVVSKQVMNIYSIELVNKSLIFKPNEWIINGNVLQYSAISTINSHQDIELESIVLFHAQPSSFQTRCMVVIDQSNVVNKTIDDLFKMETTHHSIYKVSCIISKSELNATSDVLVAIVDSRDHIPLENIFFQTPVQRPRPVKKKQSLINCIQTLRNINALSARQLDNYIKINKAMSVDKLRFCTIDYENEIILNLTRIYSDYIDFVPIDLNVERVCTRLGLEVNSCRKKWAGHFDQKNLLGLYEKTCSNECFMRYRYEYQYISNYDIDELIFPRFHNTNYPERVRTSSINNESNKTECVEPYQQYLRELKTANFSYNVNYFVQKLMSTFGKNVACFLFENFLVINRYDYFFDKIKESSQKQLTSILYENQKDSLKFQLSVGDNKSYLQKLVGLIDLAKCMNETYLNTSKLTNIWKNGAANLIDNRFGKSISNTDNALSLNPHSCSFVRGGTSKIFVPVDMGIVSHFRVVDIPDDRTLHYSIKSFKIDIEYLFFLASIINHF